MPRRDRDQSRRHAAEAAGVAAWRFGRVFQHGRTAVGRPSPSRGAASTTTLSSRAHAVASPTPTSASPLLGTNDESRSDVDIAASWPDVDHLRPAPGSASASAPPTSRPSNASSVSWDDVESRVRPNVGPECRYDVGRHAPGTTACRLDHRLHGRACPYTCLHACLHTCLYTHATV